MLISVDDNLKNLYNDLKNDGYSVHLISENIVSNVVVYSGENTHFVALNASLPSEYGEGVFMINGDNKTAIDIEDMIRQRSYSSIF